MILNRGRRRLVVALALALGVGAALVGSPGVAAVSPSAAAEGARPRLDVVAAFYPVAFAAQRVGGPRVRVSNLTPPGVEPHDLELSPKQRDQVDGADVVLVMGAGFQPSIEKAARTRGSAAVSLLDELPAGRLRGDDPHVWLDPTLMALMVGDVARAFTKADPAGKATYEANAAGLTADLAALDDRYSGGLADCDRHLLVTAHEAFGYLARAYGLEQQGVSGLAPGAEPDPRRLGELADLAKRRGVTTVFTESLVSPRIARTLAREAGGIRTAVLNPLEGLTAPELRAGDDYLTVMDRNLSRLRTALGCR